MRRQNKRDGEKVQEPLWGLRSGLGFQFAYFALLASASGCTPSGQLANQRTVEPLAILEVGRDAEAKQALQSLQYRYATTRAYADRGTAILTSWVRGERTTVVGYFRTEFLRGRAFRFRYYEETGTLLFGIWASGSTVRTWFDGKPMAAKSVEDALIAARGVTALSAWIVPTLLLGQSLCSSRIAVGGEEELSCGNCLSIAIASTDTRQQLMSMDVREKVLRRFREVNAPRLMNGAHAGEQNRTEFADDLLTYEPSFDAAAETQIGSEIDQPPW